MAKTLETHDKLIREIFEGSYQFEILTQEVRSEDPLTPAMLADRQKRVVGVLKRHWALEVSPTESVSKAPDISTATQGQA
ncbi:hypothetical protein WT21_04265 [Burkholderia territorii]|uniref:hypothetical protein n=1 Tax=Burkholderia territorii TaxID=1503055 RepID=UPI000757FFFF|nr:hypothetical protein [Burkholderia territorii]KVQ54239.1 hypothetical protein WT21_04265 [Burkholderia territorii]